MSTAKEINKLLDRYSKCKKDLEEIRYQYESNPEFTLKDSTTGKSVTKDFVLNKASGVMEEVTMLLDKATNGGKSCKDMFTNIYYVNDTSQDKIIAEEIRTNKLNTEIDKQADSNN